MGRTVPTFTAVIQQEMDSWSKFRRGLRREDQEALDDLFRAARLQLAGSAYAARPIPFESIAMSMLLSQHRTILRLEQLTRQLADRVQTLEGGRHEGEDAPGAGGPEDAADRRMAV
jgi:hypothetical protein